MQKANSGKTDRAFELRHAIVRSRNELIRARRAVAVARQDLIENLGDWMCGEGSLPDSKNIESLALLTSDAEAAERRYAASVGALVADLSERSRTC